MANKRMFNKKVIDSDIFLDMPQTTQNLYFHLNMRGDDDGFVDAPKKVMRSIGSNQNDLEILLAKRYLLAFESGVIVIKHWKLHNTIRKDRYNPTLYQEELKTLIEKDNGIYTESYKALEDNELEQWQPVGNQMTTIRQPSIDKVRVDERREDKIIKKINKKESSQPYTTFTGTEEKPKSHTEIQRERIGEIKQHWKSLLVLPQSRLLDTNESYSHSLLDVMRIFPNEDIIQAINNLSNAYPQTPVKYRIKSFSNFMTLENIEKWYPVPEIEDSEGSQELTAEQLKSIEEMTF